VGIHLRHGAGGAAHAVVVAVIILALMLVAAMVAAGSANRTIPRNGRTIIGRFEIGRLPVESVAGRMGR